MDSPQVWQIGYGFTGGVLAYLVFQGILALKCFRLGAAIGALQQQVLTLRTQGYVNKRWDKREEMERELAPFKNVQSRPRYDNDPLEVNPQDWRS